MADLETTDAPTMQELRSQINEHRLTLETSIARLEELLSNQEHSASPFPDNGKSTSADPESKDFTHVYRFHSPTVSLSKTSRNVR